MSARLFVDNLPVGVGEEALMSLFAQDGRGVVSVSIMADRQSGESHGYAFIDMVSANDARSAIASLHGQLLRGQRLHVSEARASGRKRR